MFIMNALPLGPREAPTLIETVIQQYGARRVLWAALVALFRRKSNAQPRPPDGNRLPAYLRKDVGLSVEPEAVDWRYLR